ncbi:MAG: glycine/sarcosine/betaine reductase selenoprotein B family protein [Hyphomicrobiaceae bacterium]
MVRLSDLPAVDAAHLLAKDCAAFADEPFVEPPPLADCRVAIITTAGLHLAKQDTFELRDTGYRVLPGNIAARDLVMSHSSVNFDRTGYQQDLNVIFPIDRLRECAAAGRIGSLANYHYALMGAGWEPHEIEVTANTIAGLLAEDAVNAALLVPV